MKEAPIKICKADFYFMTTDGYELARKGYVCPKLPLHLLHYEYAYLQLVDTLLNRRAFKLLKVKNANHYQFRVEFHNDIGSPSFKNFNKY